MSAGALDAGCGDRVLTCRISRGGYPTCGRRPGARRQRGRRPFGCGVRCPGQGHMPRRAAIRGLLTTLNSPPSTRHPQLATPRSGHLYVRILQYVPRSGGRFWPNFSKIDFFGRFWPVWPLVCGDFGPVLEPFWSRFGAVFHPPKVRKTPKKSRKFSKVVFFLIRTPGQLGGATFHRVNVRRLPRLTIAPNPKKPPLTGLNFSVV